MEPNDGNLYVIDDDSQHILLVDVKRKIVKTIMKPDKNSTNVTNIKQITIDLREKWVAPLNVPCWHEMLKIFFDGVITR